MHAIEGRTDIERAGAERVVRPTFHIGRQVRNALAHLRRRGPAWPLGLAGDAVRARPGKAVAANADAVLHGLATFEHEIETALIGLDDDGARLVRGGVVHDFLADG